MKGVKTVTATLTSMPTRHIAQHWLKTRFATHPLCTHGSSLPTYCLARHVTQLICQFDNALATLPQRFLGALRQNFFFQSSAPAVLCFALNPPTPSLTNCCP